MNRVIITTIIISLFAMTNLKICYAESEALSPPASIELLHKSLIKQLSEDQISALESVYSDFRLVKLCSGHFSGGKQEELVLGAWKPVEADTQWKTPIHRVGLIRVDSTWQVHVIDDEIEKDEDMSHSFPMQWKYSLTDSVFAGEMKCGIESEFGKESDLTTDLGDKPFFDLKKAGLQNNKVACFATDDVYNNWDCVVYSPDESRFKLWYQQAHAD